MFNPKLTQRSKLLRYAIQGLRCVDVFVCISNKIMITCGIILLALQLGLDTNKNFVYPFAICNYYMPICLQFLWSIKATWDHFSTISYHSINSYWLDDRIIWFSELNFVLNQRVIKSLINFRIKYINHRFGLMLDTTYNFQNIQFAS